MIRGGTVFDGTGAPGRVADVAIADGVIREIGAGSARRRRARRVGLRGHARLHRHSHALRRAGVLGSGAATVVVPRVTTVVAGNCGFAIAPTRPEHRDTIVGTLENVEDMDPATLVAGIAWEFETFPEYLDAVRRRGTALNFTAYIGHSPLRLYVMGDAAYERAATAEEIERMGQLVGEAIGAGAAGFSTSFSYAHRGVDGKPVPSRFAEPTRSKRCSSPRATRARASCSSHPASSAPTPTSTSGSRRSGARSPTRCSRRRAASTSNRSGCTSRASSTARRCGRR